MKLVNLNGLNSTQSARLQQPEPVRTKEGSACLQSPVQKSDQVRISTRAEEAGRLSARVSDLADVRQNRIDSLRAEIQSQQYEVSSSDIADAIIQDERP
jgi:flagellar biosynthesis anti-sigma factor FlgM